jgi:hypothetical protein
MIELNKTETSLKRKCKSYKKLLYKINNKNNEMLDESEIFSDVSMQILDSKLIKLQLSHKELNTFLNKPAFGVNETVNERKVIGL